LHLDRFDDERGFFVEVFRASWFPDSHFVQGNLSSSRRGVLRGLHYHLRQQDLWSVATGTAFVALVDLRESSPTYLAVETFELDSATAVQIPEGIAHGFVAVTDLVLGYLVTNYYDGSDEHGVAWDDPDFGIPWPVETPILSERDRTNPRWSAVAPKLRPGMGA
jgi:dTDP-4-dehydrorhamnose 3,5-epimerase